MSKLVWDKTGEHFYETGTKMGVLYVQSSDGTYGTGVAWSGLTGVTESPSGAEETAIYADDIKYASLRSAEEFGGTITAYTYPDEWCACDGSVEIAPGVFAGQQLRSAFALCYRTTVGNDTASESDDGYKLHLVYGATVSPSERAYKTINDSPEAIEFSWEFTTTPVSVSGHKATAILTIDSRSADKTKLAALEAKLYGDDSNEPTMPTPDEVIKLMKAS